MALEQELPDIIRVQHPHLWCRIQHLRSGGMIDWSVSPFFIVIVGVAQRASESVQWLIDHVEPDEVVNIGTAGSTQLATNQFLMVQDVTDGSNVLPCTSQCSLPIPYHRFDLASCYTVSKIDVTVESALIDMEAFHIASVCSSAKIPYSIFKYITDSNNTHLKTDFNQNLIAFHDHLNEWLLPLFSIEYDSIAVVIPAYNRPDQLLRSIDSVLNQTVAPTEIFVVDDGSDVPVMVSNNSVQVLRCDQNSGVSAARNLAIQAAHSDWIALLDSDDEWDPNHLDALRTYLKANPLLRWAQSEEVWIRNGSHFNKKHVHRKPDGWGFDRSLDRCLVSPSAVIIHRSMFNDFGLFDTNLMVCEDYDLWLRMLRYRPIGLMPKVTMTKYGGHGDQLSSAFPAMDRFRVRSLIKLIESEKYTIFKAIITQRLLSKLEILINGAEKRKLFSDLEKYRALKAKYRSV